MTRRTPLSGLAVLLTCSFAAACDGPTTIPTGPDAVGEPLEARGGGRGPAAKVTVCHRTDEEQNPWVEITVNGNALEAHKAHGDFVVTADDPCPPEETPETGSPIARLTLDSEAGDFIGQGGTFDITYTPDNGSFFVTVVRTVDSEPALVRFGLGTSPNTLTSVSFGTDQLGTALQPGFYPDAERAVFASPGHPGLDVSFQHRGCNTLTGEFTIHEVTFSSGDSGTEVETLSVSFEQHCGGAEPALHGTFTYDAHGGP